MKRAIGFGVRKSDRGSVAGSQAVKLTVRSHDVAQKRSYGHRGFLSLGLGVAKVQPPSVWRRRGVGFGDEVRFLDPRRFVAKRPPEFWFGLWRRNPLAERALPSLVAFAVGTRGRFDVVVFFEVALAEGASAGVAKEARGESESEADETIVRGSIRDAQGTQEPGIRGALLAKVRQFFGGSIATLPFAGHGFRGHFCSIPFE